MADKRLKQHNGLPVIELGQPFYLMEQSGGVRKLLVSSHHVDVQQDMVPVRMLGEDNVIAFRTPVTVTVTIDCVQVSDDLKENTNNGD